MKNNRAVSLLSTLLSAIILLIPVNELRADEELQQEYGCDSISIDYVQTSSWNTSSQANVTLTNETSEPIDGWSIEIVYAENIVMSDLWNAQDLTDEETAPNTLIIGNEEFNYTIEPYGSITFGLTVDGEECPPEDPISIERMEAETEEIIQEEIEQESVEYGQFPFALFSGSTTTDLTISGWKSNITGEVYTGSNFVYQGSELDINGIVMTVGTIQPSGWQTYLSGSEEGILPIEMPDWDDEILQRADSIKEGDISISDEILTGDLIIVYEGDITLNADTISGDGNIILYSINGDITINGTQAEMNGILYAPNGKVSINAYEMTVNGRIVADSFSYSGSILTVNASENDLEILFGEPDPTTTPTPEPTPDITVTPVPTPTVTEDPEEELIDSDHDGILDYMEEMLGTEPEDPDTDHDGILDGDELDIEANPFVSDSDGDGITDFDEDYDGDGISNGGEYATDTCMFAEDSDYDGINDHDEIYVYGTDPRDEDSDDDGILDGDEVGLGLDPSSTDSDNNGTLDTFETFMQDLELNGIDPSHPQAVTEVSISGYISGLITSNTVITDMYGADVMSSDVPGLIGVPVDIETEGYFEEMTITFTYDENRLNGTDEADLGILWFDQANGQYVLLDEEQTLDTVNNKVSYVTDHFSKYMLVDTEEWLSAWADSIEEIALARQQYEADHPAGEQYYDFYFLIEASYNTNSIIAGREYQTLQYFFSNMRDGDRVRIVFFDTRYDVYDFTATNASERDQLLSYAYNYLLSQYVYGGYGSYITAYSGALASINMADDIGNSRMVYVLTEDSDIIKTDSTVTTIQNYKNQGIFETGIVMMKQPTVSGFNFAKLIADGVGGDYYQYPLYTSLWFYFLNQYGSFSTEGDSDGDGISDKDEICGLLKPNSLIVKTDPNLKDTDGDTLYEMDELDRLYPVEDLNFGSRIPADSSLKSTTIVTGMKYDPTLPDSDDDGYLDNEDANPDKNPDMVYLFCNPDFYDPALKRAQLYRDSGLSVIFARFSDYNSFVDVWNGIGLYGAYNPNGYQTYGDKYYYNAKYVVICSHGNNESICLGSNNDSVCEKLYAYDFSHGNGHIVGNLSNKRIESLNLYACSCGKKPKGSDKTIIAQDFVEEIHNIKQVVAADTTLYGIGNKYFFKSFDENNIHYCDQNEYIHLKLSIISEGYEGSLVYSTDLESVKDACGFAIYTIGNEPQDYYSDDIIYGALYTTDSNYENNTGIIYYDFDISEVLGDIYHDPVID